MKTSNTPKNEVFSVFTALPLVLIFNVFTLPAQEAATSGADQVKQSSGAASAGSEDVTELSNKATDPTASLMAFNFQGVYSDFHGPSVAGEPDERWQFQFRPVIPFEAFGHPNILRLTVPYQIGGRGDEGWDPISVFDLVVFNEKWGRWGIGPVMSFDTTGDAPDEFVIGPAIGGVAAVNKKLKAGLFSQNVFWSDTAVSQLQPVIAYQLGHGWSLSVGDAQFTYDWEDGRWTNVPIGFQIGKVLRLGKLPVRLSVNPQYNLIDRDGYGRWNVSFTFTALFPSF